MPIKTSQTFISGTNTHNITIYSNPPDSKKYPVVFLLHGNFGLVSPYGDQIQNFANDLANLGYITAVPHYYLDNKSHLDDTVPKVQILADAIATVVNRAEVDPNRIGLVGFSLGATTAMSYISSTSSIGLKVLADFFGFTTSTIQAGISRFPPTIIFHNVNDRIVSVQNSEKIEQLLASNKIDHQLVTYDEKWQEVNHAFQPGKFADVDSRTQTVDWLAKHLPPTGN